MELEADACYVVTDQGGRFLLAAYLIAGMVTVHPIGNDGAVRGPACDQRITEIYAHSILTDPSNRYVFVPHVAPTDSIHQFRFDAGSGKLRPAQVPKIATTPGHGPRHLAFHPAGRVVYGNEEQSSSIGAYRLDPSTGGLTLLQSLSTLPRRRLPRQKQYRVGPGPSLPERPFTFPTAATTALPSLPSMPAPDCFRRWVGSLASPFLGPWAFPPTDASFLPAATSPGGYPAFGSMNGGMLEPLETYEVGEFVSWILPLAFN